MLQIKIKGSNAEKRTIIDSLRCQFIKEKDKLYMMRFKSLPNHKRSPRNSVRIDIPSMVKVSTEQVCTKIFQKPTRMRQEMQKTYLDSSIQQLDPHLHLKFYQQQDQVNQIFKKKKNIRVKSMAAVHDQEPKQKKLYKTIENQSDQKYSHSSLRDYINRFYNLKEIHTRQDKELVEKITNIHAEKIQPYKRQKNFHRIALVKKDQFPQNQVEEFFEGQLSPNICRIQKLHHHDPNNNRNILKRIKKQKTIENSLIINRNQDHDKVLTIKQNKKNFKQTEQFKKSLGPWRNSAFDFKMSLKNNMLKNYLS